MKRFSLLFIVLVIICGGLWYLHQQPISAYAPAYIKTAGLKSDIKVYFSPKGGCTDAIVNEIDAATSTIRVQAYSYTAEEIVNALIRAHQRGVDVEVIVDKSQKNGQGSRVSITADAGIPIYIDSKHAIAHNKIMIIDNRTIITGSFNFTKGAEEKNAENLLIIKSNPELVNEYLNNYAKHKAHVDK
jgi:phosphatidylserine/phosphatidylglycerophosphate/cardiolipin synthase-like enzyme